MVDADLTWTDRDPDGTNWLDCGICGERFGEGPGDRCIYPATELHALILPAPPAVVARALGWPDPGAAAADPRACDWPAMREIADRFDWPALVAEHEAAP